MRRNVLKKFEPSESAILPGSIIPAVCLLVNAPRDSMLPARFGLALNHADLFDASVEVHQESGHVEVRMSSMNGPGKPIQLMFVDLGFLPALRLVWIRRKISSQQK